MVAKHARTQDAVALVASARLDSHAVGVTHVTRRLGPRRTAVLPAAVQTTPDMQTQRGGKANKERHGASVGLATCDTTEDPLIC